MITFLIQYYIERPHQTNDIENYLFVNRTNLLVCLLDVLFLIQT